jgi:cell wall-associated NlpC family hydrolase
MRRLIVAEGSFCFFARPLLPRKIMHFQTESVFPQSSIPIIVGSNSLNGTLNSDRGSAQQLSWDRQLEGLSNSTLESSESARSFNCIQTQKHKQFQQETGASFDKLTYQNTEQVVQGQPRFQFINKDNTQRKQNRLHSDNDNGDSLTGARKEEHLVGETEHGLVADKSLTRSAQATAPPFPGQLLKYNPGQPIMKSKEVRQWQTQMRSRGWHIDVDGAYGPQSAKVCRQFQQEKKLQSDGIVGSQTWKAAWTAPTNGGGSPSQPAPSGAATGSAIARLAQDIAEGKYNGGAHPKYVLGAENNEFSPSSVKRTDCSELVQVVVSSTNKKSFVDGSRIQAAACKKISVTQAMRTPGALLFVANSKGVHHVEVSLGNGTTAAARSTKSGVGVFRGNLDYTSAGLIPGIKY